MTLPDFLIIGVAKAGTTALRSALAAHPSLYLPPVKEPKFFLTDGPPPRTGGPGDAQTYQEHVWRRTEYEELFAAAAPGQLCGEATPFYLYDRAAQRRIRALVPCARLVVVLRDPVDRAHSNWAHLWAAGLEPYRDFLAACGAEDERRAAGWAPFWHYLSQGRYGEQLEHLYRLFPREQVLVLRYRDLRDAPRVTLDRVCAFLGVATGVLSAVPAENVSPYVADTRVNAVLRAALRAGGRVGHHFPLGVRRVFRVPLLRLLQRDHGDRPKVTEAERRALLPYFADDIRLLERVTGERFSDWLSVGDAPLTVR